MSPPAERRARWLLVLFIVLGEGLLALPLFLAAPAFLDIEPRDAVFAGDLAGKPLRLTDQASGAARSVTVERAGGRYVARLGAIDSGPPRVFTVDLDGYRPTTLTVAPRPLARTTARVDLAPAFGRLELSVVNAVRNEEQIAAVVKEGGHALTAAPQGAVTVDLPAGRHALAAAAAGYCPGESTFEVTAGTTIHAQLPLSPELARGELARLILGWHDRPRDLDAHFRRLGTTGYPNAAHVFFAHQEGEEDGAVFARLDVDRRYADGFETVTVLDAASGDYEYYVHHFAGDGSLGTSRATLDLLTAGCRRRHYEVPVDCRETIWNVTHLHIHQGQIDTADQQRCEVGIPLSAGGKVPETVAGAGSP